jgi:glutamine amidotransferase
VIAVVDYGVNNLRSVVRALAAGGHAAVLTADPEAIRGAERVVVPGVGHFAATRALDETWRTAIRSAVDGGIPLLGICLGMQWLFEGSDEAPDDAGLGILQGTCTRITGTMKVPHVGWNTLDRSRESPLLEGVDDRAVYFTHSYVAPVTDACIASTFYGSAFASVVAIGRVAGVQWHPEKSGTAGLQLLRNFLGMVRAC